MRAPFTPADVVATTTPHDAGEGALRLHHANGRALVLAGAQPPLAIEHQQPFDDARGRGAQLNWAQADAYGEHAYWDTPTGESVEGCHRSKGAGINAPAAPGGSPTGKRSKCRAPAIRCKMLLIPRPP